ncbi:putative outermembrane protein [Chryseobacterium sp. StRB126]|nr:putative outermembrane protein [Chryseobacterium sp. StRB126]
MSSFVFGQKKDSLLVENNADLFKAPVSKKPEPLSKKGQMFFFYGWNRAAFSNSDIRFKGNGYDFQLNNVTAQDRPTKFGLVYFDPSWFTVTQYNFRIGYFIKDNLALVLGIDHMKYVMDQDQTVNFKGHISDPEYAAMVQNGQVNLADEKFLTFEHTDGLNYENLGLEKYQSLINKKNVDLVWSYGAGIGFMFPKSNVKLFGNERSDRFHVAGMGTDVRASLNLVLWNHVMVRLEGKAGYINMWDIKTTLNNKPDKAQQDFVFGQIMGGIGYTFNTKKYK